MDLKADDNLPIAGCSTNKRGLGFFVINLRHAGSSQSAAPASIQATCPRPARAIGEIFNFIRRKSNPA